MHHNRVLSKIVRAPEGRNETVCPVDKRSSLSDWPGMARPDDLPWMVAWLKLADEEKIWRARRDSNPQHPGSKPGTLSS